MLTKLVPPRDIDGKVAKEAHWSQPQVANQDEPVERMRTEDRCRRETPRLSVWFREGATLRS